VYSVLCPSLHVSSVGVSEWVLVGEWTHLCKRERASVTPGEADDAAPQPTQPTDTQHFNNSNTIFPLILSTHNNPVIQRFSDYSLFLFLFYGPVDAAPPLITAAVPSHPSTAVSKLFLALNFITELTNY